MTVTLSSQKRRISLAHCSFSEAGQMMSTLESFPCRLRNTEAAMACTVFPRPMSSPKSARPVKAKKSVPSIW